MAKALLVDVRHRVIAFRAVRWNVMNLAKHGLESPLLFGYDISGKRFSL